MVVQTAVRTDTAAQILLDSDKVSQPGGLGPCNIHNVTNLSWCEMGSVVWVLIT